MRRRAAAYVAEAHKKNLDMRVAGKLPAQSAGVSARKMVADVICIYPEAGTRFAVVPASTILLEN